jgi:hypothetical protein
LQVGIVLGLIIEVLRKLIKSRPGYQQFASSSRTGRTTDFLLDAVVLSSPYASSFGGFVELPTVLWWTAGGLMSALYNGWKTRSAAKSALEGAPSLPPDMSTMSLVGGGLIAGDSLAALSVGVYGLLTTVLGK